MATAPRRNTLDRKKLNAHVVALEIENKRHKIATDAIKTQARGEGFNLKGIAFCVQVRRMKPSTFRENEDLRDVYLSGIGMAEDPPLYKFLESLAGDLFGEAELIERLSAVVPRSGAITIELGGAPKRITRSKDDKIRVEEVKPEPPEAARGSRNRGDDGGAPPPQTPVPDCDGDGAEELGREAARADKPITDNPFPFADKRRPRWDKGWRAETGTDGMGPDDE